MDTKQRIIVYNRCFNQGKNNRYFSCTMCQPLIYRRTRVFKFFLICKKVFKLFPT